MITGPDVATSPVGGRSNHLPSWRTFHVTVAAALLMPTLRAQGSPEGGSCTVEEKYIWRPEEEWRWCWHWASAVTFCWFLVLRTKFSGVNFNDLIGFIQWFMEQAAPARQIEVSSAELCTATGFTEHSYSRSTEVTWAFAEWLKQGYFPWVEQRAGLELTAWPRPAFPGRTEHRIFNVGLLMWGFAQATPSWAQSGYFSAGVTTFRT